MQRWVITGPTGWVGQALLAHLAGRGPGPLADCVTLFGSSAREVVLPWGDRLPIRDLASIRPADVADAHVVHLAYLTKEKAEDRGERVFFDANIAIDDAVLSALEGGPASLFVASSGAAKLAAEGADLHPYGLAKLRQEARFLEWGHKSGVPVLAGRIFNIAGPHINKLQSYAISNFILQAMQSGVIRIEAKIPVFRSFIHIDDMCGLIVDAGSSFIRRNCPIDLCGAEVLEMGDIAYAVGALMGRNVAVERDLERTDRSSVYLGHFPDTKALAMAANRNLRPFSDSVKDTLAWLLEIQKRL